MKWENGAIHRSAERMTALQRWSPGAGELIEMPNEKANFGSQLSFVYLCYELLVIGYR